MQTDLTKVIEMMETIAVQTTECLKIYRSKVLYASLRGLDSMVNHLDPVSGLVYKAVTRDRATAEFGIDFNILHSQTPNWKSCNASIKTMNLRASAGVARAVTRTADAIRHASSASAPVEKKSRTQDLGRQIFAYFNLQTNQVIYSLTRSVKVHPLHLVV
jgi:Transcriptional regulation of mitochondrial recombination